MVYLAEVHGFYTFATQCWADGRRRRRLAGADNQFDDLVVCESFARHFVLLFMNICDQQSAFTCDSNTEVPNAATSQSGLGSDMVT